VGTHVRVALVIEILVTDIHVSGNLWLRFT
jgi:hypothetical protein